MQLRVELDGIEPPVWRRLAVHCNWHLGELHLSIHAAFNWWNYHLHEFRIGGLRYGDPDMVDWSGDDDPRVFDERTVRLLDFNREPGLTFTYLYDFGDDRHHTLTIEGPLFLAGRPRHAICLDGARARPPEDVDGIGGYERFLAIMADPGDPEHAEFRRWCGGYFAPEWFDRTRVDKGLKSALKPNVPRRLHQPKPKRIGHPSYPTPVGHGYCRRTASATEPAPQAARDLRGRPPRSHRPKDVRVAFPGCRRISAYGVAASGRQDRHGRRPAAAAPLPRLAHGAHWGRPLRARGRGRQRHPSGHRP